MFNLEDGDLNKSTLIKGETAKSFLNASDKLLQDAMFQKATDPQNGNKIKL